MGKDISSDFEGKHYLLNTNTGVAHDLKNNDSKCEIEKIKKEHIYLSDYFYSDIKSQPTYKEECDHCMHPDG
ncbi:hypothetical protein IAI10_09940 [Clostridium sp. 19966]|uniref:hypothetical protein n=1 Tax=Clostridium sp. 19966 TaxID=2768166 RepID=UPI0028E08EE5|nr:hypothetical protein [Clostridium sp. 19966]MDT8716978.1 hypothetical protein [Clostridium sp. 19966]